MGIYYYSDFVQRNGQHLYQLVPLNHKLSPSNEEPNVYPKNKKEYKEAEQEDIYLHRDGQENPASNKAILVLVPDTFKQKDIYDWSPNKLEEFEIYYSKYYNKDCVEFGDVAGYSYEIDYKIKNWDRDHQEATVWSSCRFEGYWIINFD